MPTGRSSYNVEQHYTDLNTATWFGGGLKIWTSACVRFSPGADVITTSVPEKGCLCLLLSSLYSPMTLQCTASLPLLKVIHTGGKLDLRLGVTHCGSCDTTGLVAAMHRGPCIAAASLLAPETLSSPACPAHPTLPSQELLAPKLDLSLHTQRLLPSCSRVCWGDGSHSESWFPASSGSSCTIDLACSLHRAAGNPSPCCCIIVYNFKCMVRLTSTPSGPALHLQL